MNSERLNFMVRLLIAVVLGFLLFRFTKSSISEGDALSALFVFALWILYGIVLFLLFGISFISKAADRFGNLYMPSDSGFRIVPEYSMAEAHVKKGRYPEAIDEYRKVILAYPEDIYPHLRIADLALKHLNDEKLAELEYMSALGKANGEDSTALAAGRLADLYQHVLHAPARALEVMKQLREKIPNTPQAKLAEERIAILEERLREKTPLPKTRDHIPIRPSRYKMPE